MNQRRFADMCAAPHTSHGSAAAAAATIGTSSASVSLGQSTAPKLSAFESELKRLADLAHTPRALYTRAEAVESSVAQARMLDHTYRGAMFAKQSDYLTQLIRSGQFRQLPLALPRLNTEVLADEEREAKRGKQALRINASDSTITLGSAEVRTRDASSLTLRDFMQVFVSAVIPSLIDRPAALLEWTLLARSALTIDEEKGWAAASSYVRNHLQRCAANGTDVGSFDKALWEDIRADLPVADDVFAAGRSQGLQRSSRGAAPYQNSVSTVRPASSSSVPFARGSDVMKLGYCRDWNGITAGQSTCAREKCSFKHACCWSACSDDAVHRGIDCSQRPSDAARDRRARGSAPSGRK
jgi:hypothetical protein